MNILHFKEQGRFTHCKIKMLIPDEPDAVLKCLINRERILIITFPCYSVPSDEFRRQV